jgi:hypothetical protein
LALRSCDQAWRYVLHDAKDNPCPYSAGINSSQLGNVRLDLPYGTCSQSSRSICLHLQPQSLRHRPRSTKATTSSSLSTSRQQSLDFPEQLTPSPIDGVRWVEWQVRMNQVGVNVLFPHTRVSSLLYTSVAEQSSGLRSQHRRSPRIRRVDIMYIFTEF